MRVYRKTKAIDKFRDEMYKAAKEMHTVIDLYTAMTIFGNYLDDTEEEFNAYIKYQMMQADYNARLKADMVAMLTEIQLEIEEIEMDNNYPFGFEPVNKFYEGVSASSRVIQQKINALKADRSVE